MRDDSSRPSLGKPKTPESHTAHHPRFVFGHLSNCTFSHHHIQEAEISGSQAKCSKHSRNPTSSGVSRERGILHLSGLLIKPTQHKARPSFRRMRRVSATNHVHQARTLSQCQMVFVSKTDGEHANSLLLRCKVRTGSETEVSPATYYLQDLHPLR